MDAEDDYARRLRDVFDLCDVDKSDLISIDHFVQLANEHFGTSGWDTDNQEVCLFFLLLRCCPLMQIFIELIDSWWNHDEQKLQFTSSTGPKTEKIAL